MSLVNAFLNMARAPRVGSRPQYLDRLEASKEGLAAQSGMKVGFRQRWD